MINVVNLFDSYSRQARLYPALLSVFSPLITILAWFPALITSSIGATAVLFASTCGVLYLLTTVSRAQGKKIEARLLKEWGGWPTTIWLRHSSQYLQPLTLERYHRFLRDNVPCLKLPSREEEEIDPVAADQGYASAVKWLQERCRGKDFYLVEKENAEYGFRRNLRGMRTVGILGSFAAAGLSLIAALTKFTSIQDIPPAIIGAGVVNVIILVGWLSIVRDTWVREAGDGFARALLANCDSLPQAKVARKKAKSES